jgi:hypothetical protein
MKLRNLPTKCADSGFGGANIHAAFISLNTD